MINLYRFTKFHKFRMVIVQKKKKKKTQRKTYGTLTNSEDKGTMKMIYKQRKKMVKKIFGNQ